MNYLLGAESVTLKRYGAVTVADHEVVTPAPTTSTIMASVQPLSGEDLQLLSEGHRQREMLKLYTQTALQVADQSTGTPADRVTIDGADYQVQQVKRYRTHLAHYRALVARVNE